MLASHICAFDDKTDLKCKWVRKLIAWLCCPNYLVYLERYRSVTCDALSSCNLFNDMMHAKWTCHALTQGIRTIKTLIKYKKCYCR